MRFVIQRVSEANLKIDGEIVQKIDKGLVVLAGMGPGDDDKVIDYMLDKTINLRIFEDSDEKMNLSVKDVSGGIMLIPNFTLYGDARKGRRPGFTGGANPGLAEELFDKLVKRAKELYDSEQPVQAGIFQADMKVGLVNDGPVTILLDSDKNF